MGGFDVPHNRALMVSLSDLHVAVESTECSYWPGSLSARHHLPSSNNTISGPLTLPRKPLTPNIIKNQFQGRTTSPRLISFIFLLSMRPKEYLYLLSQTGPFLSGPQPKVPLKDGPPTRSFL